MNFHALFSQFGTQTTTGLAQGAIIALFALGYTLVYGVLRLINFAHSEVFMLGTFAAIGIWSALGYDREQAGARRSGCSSASCSPRFIAAMVVSGATARRRGAGRLPAATPAQRAAAGLPHHRDRRLDDPFRDGRRRVHSPQPEWRAGADRAHGRCSASARRRSPRPRS